MVQCAVCGVTSARWWALPGHWAGPSLCVVGAQLPTSPLLLTLVSLLSRVTGLRFCLQSATMERQQAQLVPLGRDGFIKDPFFSSTWEEFDQERNLRLSKSKQSGFWDKMEKDMEDFERSVASMEADLDERMAPFRPSLPDWALPQDQQKNWPKIMNDSFSSSSSLASGEKVTCSGDSWEVSLDVANFSPDGLKVAVAGDTVTVSGSQETSSSSGENSSRSSSSFSKSYTLPSGCDPENVSSSLNNKGQLIVTCPRPYYLQGPSKKAIKFQ